MMCIICCRLPRNWRRSWIVFTVASGFGNLANAPSRWRGMRSRSTTRPTADIVRRAEQLRAQREKSAGQLELEPPFIASRGTLEAIAADPEQATRLLAPWQRELIRIG